MTPAMILEHLRSGVDVSGASALSGTASTRSVRETIAWSYALLGDPDGPRSIGSQCALDRSISNSQLPSSQMSTPMFGRSEPGTTARDRVAATRILELIESLAEASLVSVDGSGSLTPYRLLETIRAFAIERLEEAGQRNVTEDRFVNHVVDAVLDILERGRTRLDCRRPARTPRPIRQRRCGADIVSGSRR